MCSVLGILDIKSDIEQLRKQALQMSKLQRHRGPDWSGIFVNDHAILAHERLAIVDIDNGAQPLYSKDKKLVLSINGEIYNHKELEKNLSTLASIAGAAPMIGFFGTVTGMILAFYKMATEQNVTPDVLAGGIYQALITTAAGLFIGILAFVGYNVLVANVEKVVFKMERTTVEFMDLLQEPTG